MLEYCVSWLTCTGWLPQLGPWLYALLCRLEKPLSPDMGSLLRDLALLCAKFRQQIANKEGIVNLQGEPNEDIAALNLFICLVAKYFDQGDLADEDD